ncbi:MAG: metallophosphoesterase [Elusimicrobiota bacterium]|jgi:predicted MPP superfamily phosphohydrolase
MTSRLLRALRLLPLLLLFSSAAPLCAAEQAYHRLVLLADPHLPGRSGAMKEKARADVNAWADVEGVAVLGDLCNGVGTPEELAAAKAYLGGFQAPVYPVGGNHDYAYAMVDGKMGRAGASERTANLERFRAAFGLDSVRYTRRLGGWLLVFLTPDDLETNYNAALSSGSLAWLEGELSRAKDAPTAVFFHAPLKGTLRTKNAASERDGFVAQPHERIRAILRKNPQVVLWASGHVHVAPVNAHYAHKVNLFDGRVLNVHTPDMDGRSYLRAGDKETTTHEDLWSNSLFLYPDKVVVKTYDHRKGVWLEKLTREVKAKAAAAR